MKAIQCVEWGGPEKLVLAEVAAAGDRSRARSACASPRPASTFPDALIVQKKYQVQPPLPFTPGTEVAGTVDTVGEGVRHLKVGDRVGRLRRPRRFCRVRVRAGSDDGAAAAGRHDRGRGRVHADLCDFAPRAVRPRLS